MNKKALKACEDHLTEKFGIIRQEYLEKLGHLRAEYKPKFDLILEQIQILRILAEE